jgi:hypothetical protein
VIITAVNAEVATNPNIAHPNQSTTSPVRLVDCGRTEGSVGRLWGGGRPGEKKSTAAIADTGRALPRVHEPRRTSWRIPHHLEQSAQVYRNTTYLVQCRSFVALTDPTSKPRKPPRPRLPTTTSSASCAWLSNVGAAPAANSSAVT